MRKRETRLILIAAVLVLALIGVLAVFGTGCSKEKSGQGESGDSGSKATIAQTKGDKTMVAKVNGTKITEGEIAKEANRLTMQMGGQVSPEQMAGMKGAMRKQAIDNMISRTLLEQTADKEGIKVTKEEIAARIDQIKKQFPSEQAFTERIAGLGMTPVDLENEIATGMKFENLLAKHTGDAKPPTDADTKAFYDANPGQFQQPEQVKASHVLVAVGKEDTPAQKAEKRAKAEKIRADLKGGADFATTAQQYSDCPSKEKGGDLGYFGKGQMTPPFDAAAFTLKVGDLSDIVESDFGYHIIKVADRKAATTIPYEEAKQDIAGYLESQGKQGAVSTYIQGLRSAAQIEYGDTTGTGK